MTRELVARARAAGLRLPRALPGQQWRPSTPAEQHLLCEARRLDHIREMLLAEVGRLRRLAPERPADDARSELARVAVPEDCPLPAGQLGALAAAAHGESVEATARRCHVTVNTVNSQRGKAASKLGAASVAHAVALAVAAGWIRVGQPAGQQDGDPS